VGGISGILDAKNGMFLVGVFVGDGEPAQPRRSDSTSNRSVTAPPRKTRARVRFDPFAVDAVDGDLPVSCTPASGSFFRVGWTTLNCSATDTSGNAWQAHFVVAVRPRRGG
jgi:hypothetical protein